MINKNCSKSYAISLRHKFTYSFAFLLFSRSKILKSFKLHVHNIMKPIYDELFLNVEK